MIKNIYIAKHHGFCMGVKRAINITEKTAQKEEGRVTILKEIVHNEAIVEKFKNDGIGQAKTVGDVSEGTLIISAHGISPKITQAATDKGLKIVDATCPLVEKIYKIIKKVVAKGYYVIHFGDHNHDETHGILGYAPDRITVAKNKEELLALPEWKDRKLGLTIQTTAHIDQIPEIERVAREKWPHIEIFNTICMATTRRQSAIMELAPKVDMILVVGSTTSANSRRLADIADSECTKGILIGSVNDIDDNWFADSNNIENIGVSAGASTPDFLVDEVIKKLLAISNYKAEVIQSEDRKNSGQKTY